MRRHRPIRFLTLLLAVLLLGGVPVYGLSESEAAEAVFQNIALQQDLILSHARPVYAVEGYSDEEVIQYFVETAMYGEYEGYRGYLLRYEAPLQYCLLGDPDEQDRELVRMLAETLNSIPGYPGISETQIESDAEILVMFSDQDTYEQYFQLTVPGVSWGYSSCWFYNSGEDMGWMTDTDVWISGNAQPRRDRDSVICEEFIQGMGLLNDPEHGYYSIFDQNRNDCDWPSELDWAMVSLLYHPSMARIADEEQVRSIAQEILDSWK